MLLIAGVFTATTYAQSSPAQDKQKTETGDTKTKVKPNTTTGDKVHNVVHPKHKRAHGTKIKHKTDDGKMKAEVSPAKQ